LLLRPIFLHELKLTGIGIFQLLLESWERRAQCVGELEKHFVHDEHGLLT